MAHLGMADLASRSMPMAEKKRGWRKKEAHTESTPSGGVTAASREASKEAGHTMKDGSFPINDAKDLSNAKHDVGRAKDPAAARSWINKRAKDIGEPPIGGEKKSRSSTLYNHPRSRAHRAA